MPDTSFDPEGMLICGTVVQTSGALAKWPGDAPRLPWHADLAGYRGNLTPAQLQGAFRLAWQAWADVIDITPEEAAFAAALVRKHFARIDGPSNVLAWSELANNTNSPKTQRYDSGDNWTVDSFDGGIPLVTVAIHEIGHVLGLDHDTPSANAIMRPSITRSLPRPTERDFQRMIGLGYRRRTAPPPPPPGPPDPPPVGGVLIVDPQSRTVSLPAGWRAVQRETEVSG